MKYSNKSDVINGLKWQKRTDSPPPYTETWADWSYPMKADSKREKKEIRENLSSLYNKIKIMSKESVIWWISLDKDEKEHICKNHKHLITDVGNVFKENILTLRKNYKGNVILNRDLTIDQLLKDEV